MTGDGLKELLDASSCVAAVDEIALYCLAVSLSSCRGAAVDENIFNCLAASLLLARSGRAAAMDESTKRSPNAGSLCHTSLMPMRCYGLFNKICVFYQVMHDCFDI
jgi:hypothetical protein